jgi:hypothetical protein
VLVPVVLCATAVVIWIGLRIAGGCLFSENNTFNIADLDIRPPDDVVVRDFIRGRCKISEGVNMFSFSISDIRKDFLANAPSFENMEITRHLPDRLKIEVRERIPLGRLGRRSYLVVDRNGVVFAAPDKARSLPRIRGYSEKKLKPGNAVEGMTRAAIELLEVCRNSQIGISVTDVDVRERNPRCVVVHTDEGKEGRLIWQHMGKMTPESREAVAGRLREWDAFLQTPAGESDSVFDMTIDGIPYSS